MTSKVEIINRALQLIGEEAISSLNDDSDRARAMNRIYDAELRAELRAHPWNCALKQAQLASSEDEPLFDFDYMFQLPSDFVRLLPQNTVTDWKVVGRKIYANDSGPLEIWYVYEITDPNEMDALLVAAFEARLARQVAPRLSNSSTMTERAAQAYKDAIAEARRTNAFENVSGERPEDEWILARL